MFESMRAWATNSLRASVLGMLFAAFATLASAQSESPTGETLAVLPLEVPERLAPAVDGSLELLRDDLTHKGVPVDPGSEARALAREAAAELAPEQALEWADRKRLSYLLLVGMRPRASDLELSLRLYDVAERRLIAVARRNGAAPALGSLLQESLTELQPALEPAGASLPAEPSAPAATPTLEDYALASQALEALDADRLAAAWERVADRAPLASLRRAIQLRAKQSGVDLKERVRLLAEMGDVETAWSMISSRAEAQLQGTADAEADVLMVAGLVQLARGEHVQARAYLERALELDPELADAHEALGRLGAFEESLDQARESYARARALAPSIDTLERLAAVVPTNQERGHVLFEAAQLADAELEADAAVRLYKRARELSTDLVGPALDAEAGLHANLYSFKAAAAVADSAIEQVGPTPERLHLKGRSARALGDAAAAQAAYQTALELEPNDSTALRELGAIEVSAGRPESGIAYLERAVELMPEDPASVRELARGRRSAGDGAAALALYEQADVLGKPQAEDLLERASLERELGHTDRAITTLEKAAELRPGDRELYGTLAELHRESGNEAEAKRYDTFVLAFAGAHFKKILGSEEQPTQKSVSQSLDALARSFLDAAPGMQRMMVLEIFEPRDRLTRALDWVRPRVPDHDALARALEASFGAHVEIAPRVEPSGYYAELIERLRQFDADASRDPKAAVMLNSVYGTDGLLLARLERRPAGDPGAPPACGIEAYYVIEARLLRGRMEDEAGIFGNSACLQNAADRYGRWNPRAIALLALLLASLIYPIVRGWGHLRVEFKLPPKTRPMFSVRLSRHKPKLKDEAPTSDERWKIREKLQALSKNEKRLTEGHRVEFTWIPARRRPYYITVRGPLVDPHTEELIGSFNAEKQITIARGKKLEIEFDMCPKQAAVEVRVVSRGGSIPDARVGLRGDAKSVRFTRGKPAFLYLDPGDYVIVAGAGAAISEKVLHVPDREPLQLTLDLYDEDAQVFDDCEPAVTPYLEGHFEGAARALEDARQKKRAAQVRALLQPAAATTLVRQILIDPRAEPSAAPMPLDAGDARAATVLVEAGRHEEAARGFLAQGMVREAAEAYENAYDWDRAADCYRQLEDDAALLRVLEKAGDGFEAACVAVRMCDTDRALSNLKWVDRRHPSYTEACLLMGELLADRGDHDLAIEKYEEASSLSSTQGIPVESQEHYARLLEDAGRIEQAVEVYRGIRRIDHERSGVKERIESLVARLSQLQTQVNGASGATLVGDPRQNSVGQPSVSRYEIVSELGRGAMGIVYKARDSVLGRMVALKKLPENMREHELAVQYFLREARSAAALNHPNVVTIYDAGQEGGAYFITMECLEGTPLDAVLTRVGKLSARDTAILGIQAATGLAYAHGQRIIHRDIKASNLFYTKDRIVKIMDFGLAKAVEEVRKQASVIAGTPYYMPPEQAIGGIVDHRSDIYSLGVTLFQFCTGTVPFQQGDVIYHHAHTPPPDPRERVPELPQSLALLILEMMAKDPNQRVQSADDVANRLRAVLAEIQR